MTKLTPEQFDERRKQFDAGNDVLDSAFRALYVCDEEQVRIVEDYEQEGEEYISKFPEAIRDQARELIKKLCAEIRNYEGTVEPLSELIKPYISARDLFEADPSNWEDVWSYVDYNEYSQWYDDVHGD